MRSRATDNEVALGCDDIKFTCDHLECGNEPTGLWKDPNSTASALALCDEHVDTDASECAVCVIRLGAEEEEEDNGGDYRK